MPTTVYDKIATLAGTDDGNSDATFDIRVVHKAAVLGAASGNQIRVTIMWGTTCAAISNAIADMWVGQAAAAGNEWDFTGNQVQVLFSGAGTTNAVVGATCTLGTISTNVLTVAGTVTGTFSVGQLISGAGVTAGTTITSLGTGGGGTGTYNLSASSTVSTGEVIKANGVVTSDFVTLGENYDNTKNYVVSYHYANVASMASATAAITNVDYAYSSPTNNSANTTDNTLSTSGTTNTTTLISKLEIQSSASTQTLNFDPKWYDGDFSTEIVSY